MNDKVFYVGIEPYTVGDASYVGEFGHIAQGTTIGKYCSIANLCSIGVQPHFITGFTSFPFRQRQGKPGEFDVPTKIGNDVWIGANSVVLAGVEIGHGAVIGAGSVVTRSIPPYAVAYGNPARVKRYRFAPEVVEALLELRWWDMQLKDILRLPMGDDIGAAIAAMRAARAEAA